MKHLSLLLIFTGLFGTAKSQFDSTDIFFSVNVGVSLSPDEIGFGDQHAFAAKSLYQNHFSFIEFALTSVDYTSLKKSYFKTGGSVTLKYFYPTHASDSSNSRFSGNLFGLDLLGINLFPKTKFVDLLVTAGLNMGSKKVRIDRSVRYKNFIFAPRITSEVRFRFGEKFSLVGRVEKQWDITNPRWKLKKGLDLIQLSKLSYSPILVSAGFGWKL